MIRILVGFYVLVSVVVLIRLWTLPIGERKLFSWRGRLCRMAVLAAAWWHERIVTRWSASVEAVIFAWGRPFYPLARFMELYVCYFLLLGWISWPISRRYLRRKWNIEDTLWTAEFERGKQS